MKLRGVLLAGVALAVCGFSTTADANERLSMYDVNSFINQMTNAVNNPNPDVGRTFLSNKVVSSATFSNTLNRPYAAYADGRYAHPAWYGHHTSSYYRYPYAWNGYATVASREAVGKGGLIKQFENKKTLIPRYHQSASVLATRMPADATSAVVDVQIREFGLSYALAPYGAQYGQKIEHSAANCRMHLKKESGDVLLTSMTCNTATYMPI